MVVSILTGAFGFIVALAVGILTNMLSTDVERRAPEWASALVRRAVGRLPRKLRERYSEEWAADLTDQESPLAKLVFAGGLFIAARKIGSAERRRVSRKRLAGRPQPTPLAFALHYADLWVAMGLSLKSKFGVFAAVYAVVWLIFAAPIAIPAIVIRVIFRVPTLRELLGRR